MKKLLLAGFFLLVPLVVLAVLVEKAFHFSLKLTRPLGRFVKIDTLGEMAVANIIAVLAILLVCLLAGLVAHMRGLRTGWTVWTASWWRPCLPMPSPRSRWAPRLGARRARAI